MPLRIVNIFVDRRVGRGLVASNQRRGKVLVAVYMLAMPSVYKVAGCKVPGFPVVAAG